MSRWLWCALSASLVGSAGCVSRDSGYAEAKAALASRMVGEVHWESVDDTDTATASKRLLSAPLTADSAARIALLRSPEVQSAFERIGVARGALVAALAIPNPEANGRVLFGRGEPELEIEGTIDLTELLLLGSRSSGASADIGAASSEAAARVLDLASRARISFIEHVAAQQTLELEAQVALAAQAGAELGLALREAGNVTEVERLGNQALFEEARVDLAQAELDVAASRERLNRAMGLWGDEGAQWKAPMRLPELPSKEVAPGDLERVALEKSLGLEALRWRFAGAKKRSNAAQLRGVVPDIRGGVGAERTTEGWGVGPVVGVGIPLFYQGQGQVAEADADARLQGQAYAQMAIGIRASARELSTALVARRDRAEFYKTTLVPLRTRLVAELQLQYNAMVASPFVLLSAKRDQVMAGRSYVAALRDYWMTRIQVDQLLAGGTVEPMSGSMSSGGSASQLDGGAASGH